VVLGFMAATWSLSMWMSNTAATMMMVPMAMAVVPQTPLWRALIETGARWSELTRCNWADVDLHGRVLTLRAANTKAGKTRRVPLLEGLVADLVRLRAFGGDRVFLAPGCVPWGRPTTNAMRIFNRVLERAGIARVDDQGRKLDIHALRTTCGSRMARNGAGIVHTQQLLGHSSITLTERHYTDLGVEEIRAAMQAMPATGEGLKGVG
jgi:integrase